MTVAAPLAGGTPALPGLATLPAMWTAATCPRTPKS